MMSVSPAATVRSSRSSHRAQHASPAPAHRTRIPLAYNVTVGDVMNRAPVTIGPKASLFDALMLMRVHDISGLPVVDAAQSVVGVLSQKDLARNLGVALDLPDTKGLLDVLLAGIQSDSETFLKKFRMALDRTTVESAMSHPAFVTQADASLELVIEVMSENSINRLPVVERNRLVGIVTPTDLVTAAFRTYPERLDKYP